MQAVISLAAASVSREELGRILGDYLSLDRARTVRRLMVVRFALLALVAAALENGIHGFSPFARWTTFFLCILPPVVAWVVELRRQRRLSKRIGGINPLCRGLA